MATPPIMLIKGLYINGRWIKGQGTTLESTNPAYGTLLWQGTNATEQECSLAQESARFPRLMVFHFFRG